MKKVFDFEKDWQWVLVWLIILLFMSCSMSKKVSSSSTTSAHDRTQVDVVQTHERSEQTSSSSTVTMNEVQTVVEETQTVTYDTDKPVDPETGKPPVKSETTSRKTTTTGKQVQEQTQAESNVEEADTFADNTQIDTGEESETTYKEEKKTSATPLWIWVTILLGLIGLLVLLWKKEIFKFLGRFLK